MKTKYLLLVYFIIIFHSGLYAQDFQQIKNIIANVNADTLMENLSILSGAKPVNLNGQSVTITSRYRGSAGNSAATVFLKNKLSRYKSLKISEQQLPDSGKNIIAVQTGSTNPKKQIIICGHFDSHLSGTLSPGADDDGTGTVAVLEAARILSGYTTSNTIVYAFFDREEEDLNGSAYFASLASQNKDSIIAVINLDMLGWDKNGQLDVEIDSKTSDSASNQLAKDAKDVNDKCNIGLYITTVNIAKSNADNDSFWKYNFPAILIIELYGNQNPYMHQTSDIVQNINKSFYEKCTKLGIASAIRYTNLFMLDGATDVKELPVSYNSLEQNYPNPFNPSTVINYKLSASGHVSLQVFDILGREVATLVDEYNPPGNYKTIFNASHLERSREIPSGIYFYTLHAGNFVETKKMLLVK